MAPKQQVSHPVPSSVIRDSREAVAQTPRRAASVELERSPTERVKRIPVTDRNR